MSEKDHKHENQSGPTKSLEEKKLEASVSQPDRVETLRSFQPSVFNANTDSASAGAVSMTTLLGLVRDDPAEAAEQSPAGRPADIESSSDTTSPSANTPAARFAADETERFNVPERSDSGTQTGSTGQSATTSQSVSATAPTDDILETGDETVSLPDRSGGGITSEPVDGGIATGQPLVSSPATPETVGVAISPTAVSTPTQSSTPPVAESGSEGISAISDSNTDTNRVDENAPIGSRVGITAKAIDDDASDTVSYSLSDDAGGLFEIDPATGVVTVAGSLDRETATSHTIQVEATSSDGSKSVRNFTIDINDLNDEAPTDITHTGGSVDEGAVAGTTVATLSTVDADASNSFSYTLTSDPSGFFEISGNQIQVKAGANIDYETATNHNVTVQVDDGNGNTYSEVISLSVNDLNDETPTDITLTGGSVNEGATAGTTVATLSTVDADASNSFSYSITSDPSGFFEISGNQIQVKAGANIDYETATSHDVTVQVDDGNGNTYSEVITLSVNDLNDETPTDITLTGGSVNEGAMAGTNVATLSTVDADASNSFSYSITSDPSGFFEISGNQIQVKAGANIDYETATNHNVTVQVDDGNGNTYSEVISLSVNDLNDETPTDITLTGGSVNEGATAGTTVATLSTVDADASNSFSYSITSDPSGFFEISGNQIQVKAGANIDYETATSHNVTVQVDDGNGNTYSEVITLNVNDLNNEAPTDITFTGGSVNEGASGGTTVATLSAVDPDSSNSFSYSITSDPSGFFEISGNQIQVKAGANIDYENATSHNVTVQVDDGNGNTYSEVITLNVNDLNDETPTDITLTGGSVNEGATAGTTVATLSTVDADASNSFSYTLTSDPSGFFEISGNQIQVKAGANIDYENATSHKFTVQVDDGNGNTYSEVISLSVNDLNDETPTDITLTGGSVNEGATAGTTVATLSTVDADASNSFSYTLTSDPSGFFEISGDQIQVKAGANIDYETTTSHNVTVQVDDGNGNTYSEVISLSVNDLNDETPTDITLTGGSVNEGATAGTTVATLSTVDADASNSFSYTLTSDPSGFFEISGNQIQVKAGANIDYETATSHDVTVQVDDGNGNTYSEVISLSVNDLNDETPTDITLTGGSVNEGATAGTTVATLSTVDADASNSFSYAITSDPSGFFEISGNQIQVKAGANIDYETATSHDVTVQVDDGNGNTYSEVISLSVNDLNDETPTDITLTGGSVNEGATAGTTVATLSTVDADASNSFSYSITSDPSGFFEISGNQIQVKAGANIDYETATSHNVTVQVDDGNGNTYSEVISLSVNDLNDETPTDITLTGGSVNEGATAGTTVATLSTVDADASNSFSYSITSDPSGFFEISGNQIQIKAGANIDYETATSHDVTVQVDDGNGNTYSEVISLSVNDLNDETPTDITLTGGSVNEGATAGTTVATLSTVDADASNSFSYSITSDPSGFFDISGNQIQVKAGANIDYETATSHNVTVQVDDGNGNTYSEVISLSVNDLNDETPTDITLTGGSVNEGATAGTTVATLSTVDADASNSFSYSITSDPSGFFEISGNQIQVKAGANIDYETATSHNVTVQVDDGNGNTYSEVISLSVNDLNDETPTDITLTGGSVNEGATAGTTVATFSTVDADASNSFSYTLTSDPSGFFEISGNQIQVKAGANIDYETATSHNVTVQVDDGNGNTYSEVISLSVNDLNDETPTDITLTGGSVNEGATAGTTVATLSTVDADASNSFSYSITSDPSGFFEISGNNIQVKAGANIDYETATSHNVTVQVDDGNGNTYSEVISLSVNDLNDETPTDITLTGGSVNENATSGTTVATLSTVDADASNSFSYTLTSDPSGFFEISGNQIQVKAGANIDYETATSHNVTVQVDDGNGNTYSEVISLSVNDLNDETPTDITLTGGSVNEGATAGTTVATLSTVDADASNSFSYTLTSDPSGFFEISGNQIQVKAGANIDYETATSHNVTVQVDDGNGNTYSEVISLSVNDLNDETPTDITLTGGSVNEGATAGTTVATLSTVDADASNSFSYSITSDPSGFFEISGNQIQVKAGANIDYETATSHNVTVQVDDGNGNTYSEVISLNVNDLNDETPTDITLTGGSVNEGATAGTTVATLSTVDADASNSFSYTLTSDPSGFFEISGNQIQVKAGASIDYETATSHNVTVQVDDGNGNTYSEVISLSVNDLNDETPTDITLTGGSVNEGATAGTTVATLSTVDADASNSFSYTLTSDPSGFFEISGNQIQVKAGANIDYETATSHNVTVQVDDGNGNTYSEVISLSVNDLNDETPTDITLTGGSVNEGATAGTTVATLSTVDADASNSFSYSITSDPSGFFEISGNQIQVKAGANIDYETATSHNVTVQVDDGNGNTYSEVISLSVNDLNDETPTDITLTGGSVNEGATAGTTVATFSTVDADASNSFSYTLTSDPSGFFEISGNQIQVKAGANIDYETATSHNVTVQVDDGNGNTYSEVISLSVNDLNDETPTDITLTGGSVNEGATAGTTVATLSTVDADASNSFSYSITSDPSGFFEISGNNIQVKAGANIDYETATSHNVTVQVDDGNGNTYSEVISLSVNDLNDETPTDITLTGGSVNENATSGTTVATLSTVDADASNSFSYTLTSDPSGFFEISGNQIQVKAGANIDYETATSHNVTVQVDDGNGNTYSEVISLSVNDLNDETPTDITLTGGSVNEGATAGTTVATLSTVDADASNSFSYTLTSDPSGFFEISGNQIQVKAGANIDYETATSHNVTVQVDDGNGNTYSEVISLSVNDLNDETPTDITLTGGSVNEGATAGTTVATLSTVDADASNSFSYSITSDPSGFFEISGNQIQVKAGANIDYETATSHNVTVQVDDGNGNTYSEVISLSVNDLNDETPTDITLTGGSVNEGATAGTTVATLSTVDADASNSFSYSITSDPSGFFEISGNQIQIKAGANIDYETATSHDVTVQVDDGNGNTYSEVISLSVNDLNDETPTDITLTGGSVNEGATAGTTVATLSTVDADASNSFSYSITSDPSGFFDISGNQIQVKAGANIDYETATSHNVTVQVDDGNGNTYSEVISLSVNDLNDETPTDITLTGGSVNEGATAGATVATLSTVDADASNSFSYSITSDPSGFFEISGNQIQVKAGANIDYETATSHNVTVQVDDGNGNTYSEVISLSVNDLNDETPTDITLTGGSVNEGATAGTTVATFSTVDADASNSFSYTLTSDPSGFFEISGNQIQVKAGANIDYETATSHNVTVQVDDGNGNTYSEVISLSVNDLNDETPTDITLTGGSVNEGATAGTTVATLSTVDADASNSFSYSITSDPSGFFEISGNNIQVKAGANIDYETATSHNVTVQVDDGNGNTYSEVISLSVNDLNDETPTDITLTGGSVNENATSGTTVATLSTVDADASNSFSYTLTSDPSGFFEISGNQIQVKAGANIDYETATSHNVTVQVDDGNGNTYSEVISLSVNDLNDETPTDITLTGGSVNEGATAGTTVATLSTVDADASNSFSYTLTSDPSGFFEISGNQIQVKAGANIDYETATSHNVTVQVDDGNGNTYSEVISLSVNDLNDETPTDITLTGGSVNEGATAGTTVATLSTVDADASNSFSYSITSDPSGFFEISGNQIQVKAGANIDYETATSHNVTVQVDDGNGNTYSEVISLNVNDLNDETPTDITLTGGSVNEGATAGTTVATLSTVDADASNSFSYTLTSDPSGFFEISGNQIQVKAGASIDYETATSHNVTVQVDDGNGNTYSEVISLSVNDLNDETPTDITLTGGSVNEGATAGTTVATLSTVDADASNSFSYTLTSDPSGFFEISGNQIQVKAGASIDYETATSHNVTVQVDDGNGNTYSEVISLSVNDLNDETPTDITLTGGSVNEGATAGTTVATLSTVDADASNSFSYTLTSDPSGFFEISGNQIQVKAGASIDYETATSHNVTVQVDDGNGNTYSEVISLSVNDLNDETPTDITLTGGSVNEGATAGTTVATLSTVDADASNSFSYTLTSDPSGFFEISGNQIQVKAGANIDYETATSHNVTVQVDDGNGNTYSEVITLNVNDLNDETPTDITLTGGSVNEGATAGTTVATLSTVDADASNSFSYSITSDPSGFFEISGNQIQVKAGANIDYETATSHDVTVQVDDGNGNTYSEVISLSVNDLNDETPTDITLTGGSVNEGATAGTTVATLSTVDADASNSFSYSITSDPSGFFEISGNQIQVKAGANIDYETATSHNVTVQVDDGNGNTYSEVITLSVNDLNDETPTDITLTGGSVNEGATAGTTVATLSTVDADASNSFSYSITSDPSGFFEISGNQIQVKAGANIDYETATSHNVTVQVDDGNGNTYSEVISLSVNDLNDETPTDITLTGGSVNEGATAGTTVATLSTVDADASNSFSYSITSDPSGFFEISGNQIQVKAGANIDYETATSHNVTVQVDDGNGNTYSEVISLSVNDLNDETPTDITLTGGSVNEGATAGTTVATLSTVDADASNSFSYTLTSDPSGFFEISGNQIQVKAGANIDYETATSHNVTVQVDDGNGNTYSEVISLSVNDLNDETPTDITLTGGSVNENATSGTTVATLSTVDADASNSFSYSITSDPSGFFEISGNQIQVKAGANIDYETATSHNVTVQVDDGNGNTYSEVISLSVNDLNEAPTDIDFTAAGTVLAGSAAGTVSSNDPDSGDTITYTLLDDASGMFSINGSTGQLTWNGVLGDPEFALQSGASNPFNGIDVGDYSAPTLVDIDGDGDLDLYVGDDDGNLDFYRNTGSESSPNFTYVGVGTYGFQDHGSDSNVTFGDLDNDGDLDALVGDGSGNTYYYQNTGSVSAPSFSLTGANQFGLTAVGSYSTTEMVDIDNDGDLDVFIGDGNGNFNYFQNIGTASSPSFATAVTNPFGLSDTGSFAAPEFIDMDGDGDMDLVVGDQNGNFEYRENTGTASSPSFAAAVNNPYGTSAQENYSSWTFGDLDGDGDLDAVTGADYGSIYTHLDTAEATVDTSTVNSYDITVKATDSGGLSTQETMTITTGTNGTSTPGSSGTINTSNYTATGSGYTVTAQNVVGGALTTASLSNVGTYSGTFAANGTISDSDSGVAAQTGYDKASGLSERLIVDFDNDLSSVSFSFNYLYTGNYGEVGHWAVYNNGILVAEADFTEASFGSGSGTVNINPGTNFDKLILTANLQTDLSDGSDYGIASISYQEAPIVSAGNDTLTGHATQDNLIYGLAGDDSLTGGSGDDVLVGGAGADALSGGAGTDTADYSTSSAAVTVNLDTGSGTGGDAAGDTYVDIEAIIASDYDDYVYGLDTGGVTVNLGAGNDTFDNDIGDSTQTDTINGGDGNDTIWGGAGNDILSGDSGNDNIHGESGDDTLSGGAGTDTITGGDGADTITGGTGNDTAYGGNGDDTFVYFIGDGDDSYYGGNSGSWTDTIQLADGTASLGTYGADWTISISQGSIDQTLSNEVVFSQDSAGQIVLQDGSTITFQEIERVVF